MLPLFTRPTCWAGLVYNHHTATSFLAVVVDMSLNVNTYWFLANQSLLFLLRCVLSNETTLIKWYNNENNFVFVVCVASWCCSHYAEPTYKYIYLQFSQIWFENENYREDIFFLNSTSLLKLFSLLYHLISVVSLLSTQRRRKRND
jgi:hypothetical protein